MGIEFIWLVRVIKRSKGGFSGEKRGSASILMRIQGADLSDVLRLVNFEAGFFILDVRFILAVLCRYHI